MPAIALSLSTPSVDASATTARRRYTMPYPQPKNDYRALAVRIFSTSDCYLEYVDAADGSARGSAYETLIGGIPHTRLISRATFAISGAGAQTIEVTCSSQDGITG